MKIPVFVSCPTKLNPTQQASRKLLLGILKDLQLEPRALGRSDYPKDVPLREVLTIGKHCHGGLILGFEQFRTKRGVWKRRTSEEKRLDGNDRVKFPTPWNQLEAGILFGLNRPLLIFREDGVGGGVLDVGTTEVFVHPMPKPPLKAKQERALRQVFLKWHADVALHYQNI